MKRSNERDPQHLIRLGEIAYASNKSVENNPYQTGTLAWSNWRYGWLKASREGEA